MVFAIFGAMAPSGGCLGHTFGVLFALAWWPWAYWALALLLVGLAVLSAVVVPSQPVEAPVRLDFRAKVRELDLAGAVVGITALVLINVAWNQAPSAGWSTPHVYLLLLLGLLLLPVFFYVELRLAPKPLLPLQALRSPELGFVLGCIACGWSCFGIWYYYLWQFYLTVRQVPPLLGAAYFAPAPVAGALASLATGRMLGRVGPAWTMVCALTAFLAGICLEATLPAQQTYWANGFLTAVVMPFGMDMSFPAATVLLSNAVPRRHQGIAASLVNTVVNYSISLALGCAGTAEAYVAAGRDATPEDRLRGYRAAWYVGIGIAGLGWALSLVFVLYRSRARTRSRKAVAAAAEAAEGSDSSK